MIRSHGTYQINNNFEPNFSAPIDSRMKVRDLETLLSPNSFQYYYRGMLCWVDSESKYYVLHNNDPTLLSSWQSIETGVTDYNSLSNKPTINGIPIEGDIANLILDLIESLTEEQEQDLKDIIQDDEN